MITADGWLDWAIRRPGPPEKQYTQPNAVRGYIPHSMVGKLGGWYSRLDDMSRLADGRFTPNAAASVHGSILLDGTVIQHYALTTSCWASGSGEANTTFVAFEHESLYSRGADGLLHPDETKPLTPEQLASSARVAREIAAWRGFILRRPINSTDKDASLYEHREMTRFGALPTACPSERMHGLWAALTATEQEEDAMIKLFATGSPYMIWAVVPADNEKGAVRCWVTNPALLATRQRQGLFSATVTPLAALTQEHTDFRALPVGKPIK